MSDEGPPEERDERATPTGDSTGGFRFGPDDQETPARTDGGTRTRDGSVVSGGRARGKTDGVDENRGRNDDEFRFGGGLSSLGGLPSALLGGLAMGLVTLRTEFRRRLPGGSPDSRADVPEEPFEPSDGGFEVSE